MARARPSTGEPGCGGAVAFGAMVRALPPGCVPVSISGVEYYNCAPGVYCRAAFQGNNLVYLATQQ